MLTFVYVWVHLEDGLHQEAFPEIHMIGIWGHPHVAMGAIHSISPTETLIAVSSSNMCLGGPTKVTNDLFFLDFAQLRKKQLDDL